LSGTAARRTTYSAAGSGRAGRIRRGSRRGLRLRCEWVRFPRTEQRACVFVSEGAIHLLAERGEVGLLVLPDRVVAAPSTVHDLPDLDQHAETLLDLGLAAAGQARKVVLVLPRGLPDRHEQLALQASEARSLLSFRLRRRDR